MTSTKTSSRAIRVAALLKELDSAERALRASLYDARREMEMDAGRRPTPRAAAPSAIKRIQDAMAYYDAVQVEYDAARAEEP